MNLADAIRKSRIRAFAAVLAVAGSALFAGLAPAAADAAEFQAYAACSESGIAAPSHTCATNDLPAAFFKSTVATRYFVCLEGPTGARACSSELYGAAGVLYFTPLVAEEVGTYTASWWVGESEVGYWRFRAEAPAAATTPAPAPTSGAPSPTAESASSPTSLPGLEPGPNASLEAILKPATGPAPTAIGPACRKAEGQVTKLKGELKHASQNRAQKIKLELGRAKLSAAKSC
jgi:hypothetical protein